MHLLVQCTYTRTYKYMLRYMYVYTYSSLIKYFQELNPSFSIIPFCLHKVDTYYAEPAQK